ncbi:MAG: hypothetical protein K2L13_00580, partial [Opitutales bacterium]|nr:hypothetical protein [Opitutales bacterium]
MDELTLFMPSHMLEQQEKMYFTALNGKEMILPDMPEVYTFGVGFTIFFEDSGASESVKRGSSISILYFFLKRSSTFSLLKIPAEIFSENSGYSSVLNLLKKFLVSCITIRGDLRLMMS